MRTFTNQKKITSIRRLVYSGSPKKGVMTVVGSTLSCYLRPLSEQQASISGMQWGQAYNIITELGADMKVGDIVTIDSTDYTIRGLAIHDRGYQTAYNKYLVVLPQK